MDDNEEELASKVPVVRQKFQSQFADNLSKGLYDEVDVERLLNDDNFVECFLKHQKLNVEKAVNMIDSSLKFRKEMDLNNLTEKSFPRWMHELGAIFYHSTDKDGSKILYLQVCKTKKDPDNQPLVKKFVSWWIDKHFLANLGERIVVLFDMTNAGLSNVDIDLVKFQISCFTTYYPALLKYMLIYDMPWILNTIWKVIRNLLTPDQQKFVIMVKPTDIQQYIPAEKLWSHMGGQDTFQYQYIPSEDSGIDIPNGDVTEDELQSTNTSVRKRVTFAKENLTLYTSFDGDAPEEDSTPLISQKTKTKSNSMMKSTRRPSIRPRARDEDIFVGSFSAISPSEHFLFTAIEGDKEYADILTIANMSDQQIAFKVKTTSPDGYRVRPSTGLIKPQNVAEISIYLQSGHDPSLVPKDRFLVMVMKVDDSVTSASQVTALWRSAPKDPSLYMDHRLCCQLMTVDGETLTTAEVSSISALKDVITQLNSQVEQLVKSQRVVDRRVTCLFIFQIMIAVTVGLFITVIVILSLLDIDINPFSGKYMAACPPWRYQ